MFLFSNMNMFYLITHNFELWPDAYECSGNYTVPETRWPKFGIYLGVSGSCFLILYFLCFIAIMKTKSSAATYQLMFLIAIFDMIALIIGSLIIGYLTYYGIFFCQYPLFFFITGCVAVFSWISNCVLCVLLAIERCSEVDPTFFLSFLFGELTFTCIKTLFTVYGIIAFLFVKPLIFSPVYSSMVYDPLIAKSLHKYLDRL
ncbi:unnamed protein product [Caenorhabditis nigoni]